MAFNISLSNDFSSSNKAYSEASLIKVIDIIIKNTIFNNHILYTHKPVIDNLQILHLSSLAVVLSRELSLKLYIVLDEIIYPFLANSLRL